MSNGIEIYTRLRQETAQLLGFDPNQMTAAQATRLDRVTTLRLLADDLQTRAVRGESIDVVKFNEAMRELETLFGGNPEAPPPTRFGVDHKARLRALIERVVLAPSVDDPGEVERTAELMRREELASVIAAGGNVEPAAPLPVAPPPSESPNNVVSLPPAAERANATRPPDHYLADYQHQNEPWRNDGAVTAGPHPWPLPR